MTKIDDAIQMLKDVHYASSLTPRSMAARFIVAAAHILPDERWADTRNTRIQIHEALDFLNTHYGTALHANTRESLRNNGPKEMARFGLAQSSMDIGMPTNSRNVQWTLTGDFFTVVHSFGTESYSTNVAEFNAHHQSRLATLQAARHARMLPVNYNGFTFQLSAGPHNTLHKAVLEQFAPRFAGGSELLYVGDTRNKALRFKQATLAQLGFSMNTHDLIPDIILYQPQRDWLYLIEAVASTGPMSPERVADLRRAFTGNAGLIFVTAFLDWSEYRKFVGQIAWETEIWIAGAPDHLIHMNGEELLAPH